MYLHIHMSMHVYIYVYASVNSHNNHLNCCGSVGTCRAAGLQQASFPRKASKTRLSADGEVREEVVWVPAWRLRGLSNHL